MLGQMATRNIEIPRYLSFLLGEMTLGIYALLAFTPDAPEQMAGRGGWCI